MFNLTYKFKLKPTQQQSNTFEKWLEMNRRVYNHALRSRKEWHQYQTIYKFLTSLYSKSNSTEFAIPPYLGSQS